MDMRTKYLGMTLKNPLVPSSSPLSNSVDSVRRLEDAGAPAVVMFSLFEEQITTDSFYFDFYLNHGTDSYAESLNDFPGMKAYGVGPDEYLNLIRRAKESVDIPIIGSLNGASTGNWIDYACGIEEAGADALELNVYYIPTSTYLTGAEVESIYTDILRDVRSAITIPIAMKLSPYFSSTANMAQRLAEEGADGLVLFNRYYQPDLELDEAEAAPRLVLSDSDELALPLRWIAVLYGCVNVDLAITTGVHTYRDALKGLMAGAHATMMASELLRNGITRIREILDDMKRWMEAHQYSSVEQIIGRKSLKNVVETSTLERVKYMKTLASYKQSDS
jgi:dihydroorotate dehydrogenase (fumarate)